MPDYRLKFGILLDNECRLPYINKIKDRFEHTYILGKTGTGKSVLMEHLANYDISQGVSTIYIDPKGDSVKKLYSLAEDNSKIKYVSIKNPMVINPLNKEGYDLDDIISEFVQILDILITLTASNPESTVLMREIVGMALRTFKKEQKNLSYLVNFLLYSDVRKEHIKSLSPNDKYRIYWTEFDSQESNRYPKNKDKIESAKRVASRLLEISEGKMKDIVQGENELYISELIKNGESLLVDTSRMSRNSRIYLSNLIVYSVLSYCEYYEGETKPLIVYVDEFQTVVSSLFTELLARSRGKKVGFVLAHHNFLEVKPEIISSIFGNTHAYVIFRCGLDEAEKLAPMFDVKPKELFNLPRYNALLRIGNKNSPIKTFQPLTTKDIKPPEKEIIPEKESLLFFLSNDWIVV